MVAMMLGDCETEKSTLSEMAGVAGGGLVSDPPPPPPPQAASINALVVVIEIVPRLNLELDNNFIDEFIRAYKSINEIATSRNAGRIGDDQSSLIAH